MFRSPLVPSSPLFLRLCWCRKKCMRRNFVSAISDMIFCRCVKMLRGCPSLKFPKTLPKRFNWILYWTLPPFRILPVLSALPNLGDHVLTGSCSHTWYLLPLVSLSFELSNLVVTAWHKKYQGVLQQKTKSYFDLLPIVATLPLLQKFFSLAIITELVVS